MTYANRADIIADENFRKRFRVALSDVARNIGAAEVPPKNGGFALDYFRKRKELSTKVAQGVDNYVDTFLPLAINMIAGQEFTQMNEDTTTGDNQLRTAIEHNWDIVAGVEAHEKPDYNGGYIPASANLSTKVLK